MHELDNKKACYDLAMTYAKVSLQYAKEHKFVYDPLIDDFEISEMEYLQEMFTKAYVYYLNCDLDASIKEAFKRKYGDLKDL